MQIRRYLFMHYKGSLSVLWGALFCLSAFAQPTDAPSGEPISPLPSAIANLDPQEVALGKMLFQDQKLSKNNTISCATCHSLQHAGVDGLVASRGINGALGDINAPTVFNSSLNFRQFWNGRAATLEEQIDGPVQHEKEMGSTWDDALFKLKQDEHYQGIFAKIYADGITQKNVQRAIATFERALITPNSKFDQFLRGDMKALSSEEKHGYQLFKAYGCVACHQGANIGGNMFQTMGIMGSYFQDRGTPIQNADLGRFMVTKNPADKHSFRVPSLRNIALTGPYFHDGSAKTLEDAVKIMAKYQLGRKLTKQDIDLIVAFLKTLTGETPAVLRENNK